MYLLIFTELVWPLGVPTSQFGNQFCEMFWLKSMSCGLIFYVIQWNQYNFKCQLSVYQKCISKTFVHILYVCGHYQVLL